MKLVPNENHILSGYLCDNCKIYNDILTIYCISCHSYRDKVEDLTDLANRTILLRGIELAFTEKNEKGEYVTYMTNDKRAELHSEFFNGAVKKVEDMSIEDIMKWEEELEEIALKAKATLQGAAHGRRQKEANLTKEQRERLVTRPDLSVSEGINVPKVRADRMSKADKLRKQFDDMVAAGMMTQEAADAIIGTVKVDAGSTNGSLASRTATVSDKTFTFNGSSDSKEPKEPIKVEPKSFDTQDTLLEDLLNRTDMSSTSIEYFVEKLNTANILIPKTVTKEKPTAVLEIEARLKFLQDKKANGGNIPVKSSFSFLDENLFGK